jgi:hypothetical protein
MRGWGIAVAAVLAVCLPACGANVSSPSALPVGGAWAYQQVVDGGGAQCGEGGHVTLTQAGTTLSGSFSARGGCDTASAALDFLRSGGVEAGAVDGTSVRFTLGVCRYEGTAVGEPVSQIGGSVRCAGLPGTDGALLGSWEMTR